MKLRDNITSGYLDAANRLAAKNKRRRIVAYVESYDDIYFWRTVLSRFEDDTRYFEVMLPSHKKLERGKKSVLMNFIGKSVGPSMIACVDADYDYLLQGVTPQSRNVLQSPYVFHTYAYAIENLQCYAPSLHDVCTAVTLNDHRIFDFRDYLRQYSEAIFPLFVWSVWSYRTGNHNRFSLADLARIIDPGGFNVQQPQPSIDHLRRKVNTKIRLPPDQAERARPWCYAADHLPLHSGPLALRQCRSAHYDEGVQPPATGAPGGDTAHGHSPHAAQKRNVLLRTLVAGHTPDAQEKHRLH